MNKFTITALAFIVGISAASADTFEVQPGTLQDNIDALKGVSEIRLTGSVDARDLLLLRDIEPAEGATLDMSALTVAELNSDNPEYLGKSYFKKNLFPSYILFKSRFAKVLLPSGIRIIEAGALAASEIKEITVPEGVTSIGEYTFYGCSALESVNLPASLVTIGKGAFANCPNLKNINIEASGVTAIPDACFSGSSSLASINLDEIHSVGSEAFSGTAISSIVMPQASYLAPFALAGMDNLREVVLNSDASFNKGTLMNNRNLISLSGVPADIPDLFAANCTAYMPEADIARASSIGQYAFANSQISDIVLGSGLTSIDLGAFKNSAFLIHIDATSLGDNLPSVDENAFEGIDPASVRLKVTDHTEDQWRQHPVWGLFNIYSDYTSGIDNIANDPEDASGISVRIIGNILYIHASQAIDAADIYDLAGNHLLSLPTGVPTTKAEISTLPKGILIVNTKAGNASKGVKIIL